MSDLVRYGNDFNFMPTPKLTENEMNFFMAIISELQYNRIFEIDFTEFTYDLHLKSNLSVYELEQTFYKLASKMLKFAVEYKTKTKAYAFVCFEKMSLEFSTNRLEIIAQKDFYELINNIKVGFTKFELAEFIGIKGKYAKNLYRLLKQFRDTGEVYIYKSKWQEFCRDMQIPESYNMSDIDKRVLNPTIEELSAEPDLFNNKQAIFKNLKYEKIKDKKSGVGRGGKVIGIVFTFDKEITNVIDAEPKNETEQTPTPQEPKEKPKKIAVTQTTYFETEQEKRDFLYGRKQQNINDNLLQFVHRNFYKYNKKENAKDVCKILDIYREQDYITIKYLNLETNRKAKMKIDSIAELELQN